jgi:hypothetical protein
MARPPIIAVEWIDAVSNSGWEPIDKQEPPHTCTTVGFLVFENQEYLTIAATFGEPPAETNNRISIPKGWIKNRWKITLRKG